MAYTWHGLLSPADERVVRAMCARSEGKATLFDNDQLVIVEGQPSRELRAVRDYIDQHAGPCGECKPGAPCGTVTSGEVDRIRKPLGASGGT